MDSIRIPETLNDAPIIVVFSASQFVTFCCAVLVGILIEQTVICTIIGLVVGHFLTKWNGNKPTNYLRHMAYFHGIPVLQGKHVLHGFDRELRP